jgi:hypothetical protein
MLHVLPHECLVEKWSKIFKRNLAQSPLLWLQFTVGIDQAPKHWRILE